MTQEQKSPQKSQNSARRNDAPRKPRGPRPFDKGGPNKAPAAAPFQSSLADNLPGDFAQKLLRHVEDNIKRRIKEAQKDPNVQKASEKYGK